MTFLRRLAVLAFLLIAASPQGHAQSVALANTNALVLFGLTFTISNCNTACAAAGLDLVGVADGRGNIEYEVVNSTPASPALSRAPNTAGAGSSTLSFTITVSQTAGKPATTVESAALTDSGVRSFACVTTSPGAACRANNTTAAVANSQLTTFSGITMTPTPPATATLTLNQTAAQNGVATKEVASTPETAFSYTESLNLTTIATTEYQSGAVLQLNTVAVVLRAAPEPASMGVFAVGLAGLTAVRRRRRAKAA